jgi:ABC-type protease/lipase transport system fused ATPase/permease subunit
MSRPGQTTPGAPELGAALSLYRNVLIGIGLISGMINVLYLTGSLFMLEVYDRVIPSRSIPTLVGLALITAGLFVFQGVLDMIRARIFVRLGSALDEALAPRAYDAVLHLRLRARGGRDGLQPLRDLEQVRAFLSSNGPGALFDLPWMPVYLAICFAFHFLIGMAALTGAIILVALTFATELLTRKPSRTATTALAERNALAESSRRNAESLTALGMAPTLRRRRRCGRAGSPPTIRTARRISEPPTFPAISARLPRCCG